MPDEPKIEPWMIELAEEISFLSNLETKRIDAIIARHYAARVDERDAEIERLREELIEVLTDAFYEVAAQVEGWYCSNARSTANSAGERLVEFGVFEEDEARGHGRVRWFRSKAIAARLDAIEQQKQEQGK